MTYADELRRIQAVQAATKREYLSNDEFRKLKAALTRAKNSGDGRKVLKAVEHAVERFNATTWVDDWALWRIALEDAAQRARMSARDERDFDKQDELLATADELYAASVVLFR